MTTVVHLPDDVARQLEKSATQRGITILDVICELAQFSAKQQALETFIGCIDAPNPQPFDIDHARAEIADTLLADHKTLNADFSQNNAEANELAFDSN